MTKKTKIQIAKRKRDSAKETLDTCIWDLLEVTDCPDYIRAGDLVKWFKDLKKVRDKVELWLAKVETFGVAFEQERVREMLAREMLARDKSCKPV